VTMVDWLWDINWARNYWCWQKHKCVVWAINWLHPSTWFYSIRT